MCMISCAVSLRFQVTDKTAYAGRSPYLAVAEWVACALVLFLAVLNFMG